MKRKLLSHNESTNRVEGKFKSRNIAENIVFACVQTICHLEGFMFINDKNNKSKVYHGYV